jgi:hypothetical protein
LNRQKSEKRGTDPMSREKPRMQNVLSKLRSDFTSAISSNQNDVTLDPSIGGLRQRISEPSFLGPFSIYSAVIGFEGSRFVGLLQWP